MLNRVKCFLVDDATGAQKQFVVPVSFNFSSVKEFALFAVKEYANVSSVQKVAVFLDGFSIRPSEQLSILRPEDAIVIRYESAKEEERLSNDKKDMKDMKDMKNMKDMKDMKNMKDKKDKKDKHNKKRKACRVKKESTPIIIDNSHNQPSEPGIAVPTNRIVRFDGEEDSPLSEAPLRIREEVTPTYTNTNTPTLNAREKKKTRRGKRAGRQAALKGMKPITMEGDSVLSSKPEASYLDYIVNEPPSVTANNTICSSFVEPPESTPQVPMEEQPPTPAPQEGYVPKVEDVIQFQYVVLNRETLSPEVKQVKGRVLSLSGSSVRVYLLDEDDIISVDVGDLKEAVVLKK